MAAQGAELVRQTHHSAEELEVTVHLLVQTRLLVGAPATRRAPRAAMVRILRTLMTTWVDLAAAVVGAIPRGQPAAAVMEARPAEPERVAELL